jgi:hypothetical protein
LNRIVAIKCYGFDWHDRFGLSESVAADRLSSYAADWALLQNAIDPLPTSDVEQRIPKDVDERRLREALRERGIRTFETTAVYFQPDAYRRHPGLRPIAADGSVMQPFDWYVGLCPSSDEYLSERAALIEEVAAKLEPDGIFLSFIRFPGFWESWTPGASRASISEYCFCPRCLERFQRETSVELPATRRDAVALLQGELRPLWTAWKCELIAGATIALASAARRGNPGTEVLINGVALGRHDLSDAGRELLGQDLGRLSREAEHTELMLYHQILARRPRPWIRETVDELRPQVSGTLLACLQTSPAYLTGPHAALARKRSIPFAEFTEALQAVAESGADGVGIYHWTDLLEDDKVHDGRMGRALRAFRNGDAIEAAA